MHAVEVLAEEKAAGRSTAASAELLLRELERAEAQKACHGDVAQWPGAMEAFAARSFEAALASDRDGAGADPLGAAEALTRAALHLEALSQLPEGSPLQPHHRESLEYARERAEHLRGCAADSTQPSPCWWRSSAPPAPTEEPAGAGAEEAASAEAADAQGWEPRPGDEVDVWSSSRMEWLPGQVLEVFEENGVFEGYSVSAGQVKVLSDAGLKFVRPEQVHEVLRQRQRKCLLETNEVH